MSITELPRSTLKRVLYRKPASLWIRHFLQRCGDNDDLEQTAWMILYDPKYEQHVKDGRFWYLSGVVADKLKREVMACKWVKLGGAGELDEFIGGHLSSEEDPFDKYIPEDKRELVRDYYYNEGDAEATPDLLSKYATADRQNIRRKAKRVVNAVKRRYDLGDSQLREVSRS